MRIAFITNLCGRDEGLYETHLKSLKDTWGGVDTVFHVSGDRHDPPSIEHQFFHDWPRDGSWPKLANNNIKNMSLVAQREEADYVCKLDVDCVHKSMKWFLTGTFARDPALIGFQMRICPSAAYGACLAVRSDVLLHLDSKRYPIAPVVRGDDIILTDLVRYVKPNDVYLFPTFSKGLNNPHRRFAGWAGKKEDYYGNFDVIHCGQPGPDEGEFDDERQRISSIKEKMEYVDAS